MVAITSAAVRPIVSRCVSLCINEAADLVGDDSLKQPDELLGTVAWRARRLRRTASTPLPVWGGIGMDRRPLSHALYRVLRCRCVDVSMCRCVEGWVLLEGLVSTSDVDDASGDLRLLVPSAEEYHADPEGVTERWKGRPAKPKDDYIWPDDGPGFRQTGNAGRGPFPARIQGAQPALRARLHRRRRACAPEHRHTPLPGPCQREVLRPDELRAADAH
jgi:hypothetical protein